MYQDALQQDQFNAQLRASRGGGGTSAIDLLSALGMTGGTEPAPVEDVGGGFIEDGGETSNWTSSAQKTNIFNAIPTLIGNYLGNTRIKKPGRELTFMEKLLNRRSNRGSGSRGGSW